MVSYMNSNVYYLDSKYNTLFCGSTVTGAENVWRQQTGWCFIPNNRYDNWLTHKQWFDLVTNHNKFIPHSCEIIVQNMIPLTDSLSIAQDTTFMSFNNTIYALGYQDNKYECNMREENSYPELYWREGITYKQNGNAPAQDKKLTLPEYLHYLPMVKLANVWRPYTIYAWDPFCSPESIMELRPGKNSLVFSWKRSGADDGNWVSTQAFFGTVNTSDNSNIPQMWDYYQDFKGTIVTPPLNSKNDPRNTNTNKKMSLHYQQFYHNPIPMMMLKLMPIMSTTNQELKQSAMIVIIRKISFEVTPRKGSINFPVLERSMASGFSGQYNVEDSAWKLPYSNTLGPIQYTGAPIMKNIDNAPIEMGGVAHLTLQRKDNEEIRRLQGEALYEKALPIVQRPYAPKNDTVPMTD